VIFIAGSRPVVHRPEQFGWIAMVRVSRDGLGLAEADLQQAVAGHLVWADWHREMLLTTAKSIPASVGDPQRHVDPDGVDHYLAATAELLIGSALGGEARLREVRLAPDERRLVAEQFIRRHLLDPELGPEKVAEGLGVSKRQLARAFTDHPGIAATIAIERLTRADHLLRDRRRAGMTVAEIAEHCQFSSPARFSKAYKAHFGVTPSEARAGASPRSG
jgi:AraC-like DNA-binding protein